MLNLIKWIIKSAIFAAVILVAANLLKWNGKTISDQVKTQLAHAERSDLTSKVKTWAGSVTDDARKGAARRIGSIAPSVSEGRTSAASSAAAEERVDESERKKLRALIRELNSGSDQSD